MFCRFTALDGTFVYLLRRQSALGRRKTSMFHHEAAPLRHFTALLGSFAYMFSAQEPLLGSFAALQND